MHSYNKGIFTISEMKTYTMKTELSYEKLIIKRGKSDKYHKINSKTYRKWSRNQRRISRRKRMEMMRKKRPSFMDSAGFSKPMDKKTIDGYLEMIKTIRDYKRM